MPVITIRGSLGSGSAEIGRQIADRLHIAYVDRQIIAEVASRLRSHEQVVLDKEIGPKGFMGRIVEALSHGYAYEDVGLPAWEMPLDDNRYLQSLYSITKELASTGSIVILGRGSQFILKDYPQSFHISVVSPFQVRLKRIIERLHLDEATARQEITDFDNSGREFIKKYFRADSENAEFYDMVLNTERLNFDVAASIVIDSLSIKFPNSHA